MGLIVWAVDKSHYWLGEKCDNTADLLEDIAETLRWLAALTRVTP